jgi:hypothetical protein
VYKISTEPGLIPPFIFLWPLPEDVSRRFAISQMTNRAGTNFNFKRLRLLDFLNKNNTCAHRPVFATFVLRKSVNFDSIALIKPASPAYLMFQQ